MRILLRCVIVMILCFVFALEGWGRERMRSYEEGEMPLLDSVFAVAAEVASREWRYRAEYYYRGSSHLSHKTIGVMTLPNRRFYRKGGRDLLTEYAGDMEYSAPAVFVRKARYTYGAERRYEVDNENLLEFLNLTIYNENLFADHVLSPLARRNARYYSYSLDSVCGGKAYFSYQRKRKNMQLVDGSFVFDTASRCVDRMNIRGTYSFVDFDETVIMCQTADDTRFWPERIDMSFKVNCYGSKFEGEVLYTQRNMTLVQEDSSKPHAKVDLTDRYLLALDTSKVVFDSLVTARLRPDTLPVRLAALYDKPVTSASQPVAQQKKGKFWLKALGDVGDVFFHDHDIVSTPNLSFKIKSPVFGYSNSKGVTVREDLLLVKRISDGSRFTLRPSVSYFNKNNEISGRVWGEYMLRQKYNEKIDFELGLRSVTTNLESMNNRHPDPEEEVTTLRFRDLYSRVNIGRELFNSFDLMLGTHLHHRTPQGYARINAANLGLNSYYRDFASQLTITYTPKMRYYFVGNRKVRVGSRWPTFMVNYARGMKGVFGSTNDYERLETVVRQDCRFSAVRRFIWQLGYGMFTAKEDAFVQYDYFNEGISAYDWDDDCSGVFQLLDSRYYNDSYHYFRAHAVYESPMLLLGVFNTRMVRAERLYGNLLMTEGLVPYFELGYGVSTAILDVSLFSSYLKSENFTYGFKFNLYLW